MGCAPCWSRVVPEAEALAGTATEIPLEDDAVDAVFVGEAFHWFGNDDAVREIARVLRPGGTLAILFNQADGKVEPPLPQAFRDALDAVALVKPPEFTVRSGLWRTPFPGPFEPFTEISFPNAVELDREGMLANIASWSTVAGLPDAERGQLLEQLSALLPEGSYRHPLSTHLYLTTLLRRRLTWTRQTSIAGSTVRLRLAEQRARARSRRSSPRTRATATSRGTSRSSAPRRSRTPGSATRTTRRAGRRRTGATPPTAMPPWPSARARTSTQRRRREGLRQRVRAALRGDGRCSEFTEWFMKRP